MQETLLSDSELLNSMIEGDDCAFQEIYRRYWYKLYMATKRKLIFEEDAQEIVQDIFVDLWERRSQVQIKELSSFLFSAVKYSILNHIRTRIVRERYSLDSFLVIVNEAQTQWYLLRRPSSRSDVDCAELVA